MCSTISGLRWSVGGRARRWSGDCTSARQRSTTCANTANQTPTSATFSLLRRSWLIAQPTGLSSSPLSSPKRLSSEYGRLILLFDALPSFVVVSECLNEFINLENRKFELNADRCQNRLVWILLPRCTTCVEMGVKNVDVGWKKIGSLPFDLFLAFFCTGVESRTVWRWCQKHSVVQGQDSRFHMPFGRLGCLCKKNMSITSTRKKN